MREGKREEEQQENEEVINEGFVPVRLSAISLTNRVLLALNLLVTVLLVTSVVVPHFETLAQARKEAQSAGRRVFFAKHPYRLLVDKDYPSTRGFCLYEGVRPLVVMTSEVNQIEGEAQLEASIFIGPDLSISCVYTEGPPPVAREYRFLDDQYVVRDLNVDGVFDMRISRDPEHYQEVWYGDGWRWVSKSFGEYRKRLEDQGEVVFDSERGRWVSAQGGSAGS